jgi:hypothetical protein
MKILTIFIGLFLGLSISSFAASTAYKSSVKNPHPNLHQINLRIREQKKLIQTGLKSGKLTEQQAISMRNDLKSVRQQELVLFKETGNHELTTTQQSQFNQILDKHSAILGEAPISPKP